MVELGRQCNPHVPQPRARVWQLYARYLGGALRHSLFFRHLHGSQLESSYASFVQHLPNAVRDDYVGFDPGPVKSPTTSESGSHTIASGFARHHGSPSCQVPPWRPARAYRSSLGSENRQRTLGRYAPQPKLIHEIVSYPEHIVSRRPPSELAQPLLERFVIGSASWPLVNRLMQVLWNLTTDSVLPASRVPPSPNPQEESTSRFPAGWCGACGELLLPTQLYLRCQPLLPCQRGMRRADRLQAQPQRACYPEWGSAQSERRVQARHPRDSEPMPLRSLLRLRC